MKWDSWGLRQHVPVHVGGTYGIIVFKFILQLFSALVSVVHICCQGISLQIYISYLLLSSSRTPMSLDLLLQFISNLNLY